MSKKQIIQLHLLKTMPQFDVFLFFSSVFYLLSGFFILMFYNQLYFLPKISAILKLREKLFSVNDKKVSFKAKSSKIVKLSNNF